MSDNETIHNEAYWAAYGAEEARHPDMADLGPAGRERVAEMAHVAGLRAMAAAVTVDHLLASQESSGKRPGPARGRDPETFLALAEVVANEWEKIRCEDWALASRGTEKLRSALDALSLEL